MATLARLPEDIIMDILSKLSVKSISRFRCVCKHWYEFFKNPNFIKTHLQHAIENSEFSVLLDTPYLGCSIDYSDRNVYYTIDFDATSSSYLKAVATNTPRDDTFVLDSLLTDSCHGLIGSSTCDPNGFNGFTLCLWNLSTREYKNIPRPASDISHTNFSRYGVFYDWQIDDYKLFRIVADTRFSITSEVWVCRLGTNSSWNSIGNIPYHIHRIKICMKPLNGIIHWIGKTKTIVSFDIVGERANDIEERIKEIQIPSCYLNNEWYSYNDMEVGVLGQELFLYVNATSGKGNLDLWVMKDYGVIVSWTNIFSVSKDATNFHSLRPLHYLNKNHEILLHGVRSEGKDDLVSYDPKSRRLVILDISCMPKHFNATTFERSLVLLNSDKFLKATRMSKVVDTSFAGTYKILSRTVERMESGYLKFQSRGWGWGKYIVFWFVLLVLCIYLSMLGSRNFLCLFA